MIDLAFRKFSSGDSEVFKSLNIEWLETYFVVEEIDDRVLSHPQTEIIDSGGHIFIEIQFKYNKVLPMVFDAIQIPNKTLSDYYKSYYYNVKENKWKNGNLPYMQFEIDK